MEQLILHLFGDYVTQSGWMADQKTKRSWPALVHATVYSLPFLLIGSWQAWLVIWSTHFLIDRFRLARFVCFAKNVFFHPGNFHPVPQGFCERMKCSDADWTEWCVALCWGNCSATGHPSETPPFLAVWLLIACDNTLHLGINFLALRYL